MHITELASPSVCFERPSRAQNSVFNFPLAAPVAGLHLTPSKCAFIVSKVVLTDNIVFAIRNCLSVNVPALGDIRISEHGKYLGCFWGRDDDVH